MNNSEFIDWINSMPYQFKKAVELFMEKKADPDVRLDRYGLIRVSFKEDIQPFIEKYCFTNDDTYKIREYSFIPAKTEKEIAISSIHDIKNVAALYSNEKHPFELKEKGINVIYGTNGRGKSSYTKIIKMMSGSKYSEVILGNIYSQREDVIPSCQVDIVVDGKERKNIQCDLILKNDKDQDLKQIDIFDTVVSNSYIKKGNSYLPFSLEMLDFVFTLLGTVDSELKYRKSDEKSSEQLVKIEQAISNLDKKNCIKRMQEMIDLILTDEYVSRFNMELNLLTGGKNIAELYKQNILYSGTINPYIISIKTDKKGKEHNITSHGGGYGVKDNDLAGPEDIFSEGESKVVSLAAFLAEAGEKIVRSPLVFDDPITSLDEYYTEMVVKRLVDISKDRQVIVFTHRLPLLIQIANQMKEVGRWDEFREIDLRAYGDKKGIPVITNKFSGESIKEYINEVKRFAAKYEEDERFASERFGDSFYNELFYFADRFRIILEKSIENEWLRNIINRFSIKVNAYTGNMRDILQLSLDDCNLIDELLSKYSVFHHTSPDEVNEPNITIEELIEDAIRLDKQLDAYKKRIKEAKMMN